MVAISWGTYVAISFQVPCLEQKANLSRSIRSLVIFFGPMLLPKAIAWYRRAKNPPNSQHKPIAPLTPRALSAIILLLAAAAVLVVSLLPILSPENVFIRTRSNPTTSTNLLFSRLATLRPLTPRDEVLHDRFESKASKLLYYKYGSDALADCSFCNSQDPTTYLLYAAPGIALPHLINALLVGIGTSESTSGKAGSQWRTIVTYAIAALALADGYMLARWDHVAGNEKARVLGEIFFYHWVARTYRNLALAAIDVILAGVLYLSATNRMFAPAVSAAERIDKIVNTLGAVNMQVRSANVIKNTVARDAELRAVDAAYWAHEGMVMQEAMESEEVVESMRDAVENRRVDLEAMNQAAEQFVQQVMGNNVST